MDRALKKLFTLVDQLEQRFSRLDALEERLAALDTNGTLAEIKNEMSTMRDAMAVVAANSRLVVHTVEPHGDTIAQLEKTLTRLNLRCPLMKPDTGEFNEISERLTLKDG